MSLLYWPYDEVKLLSEQEPNQLRLESPWFKTTVRLREDHSARAMALASKFETKSLGPNDLEEINWFFTPLAQYPLCYVLPRAVWSERSELYSIVDATLLGLDPVTFLDRTLNASSPFKGIERLKDQERIIGGWTWDIEGAIQFARTKQGIDPLTLFTVARRYHLLSACESDCTERLYNHVRDLKRSKQAFKKAAALMVRQNHYVTQECHRSLAPALEIAQGAVANVEHFMSQEAGHDRILKVAMKTMVEDPQEVPVTDEIRALMELLKFAAGRNFLAFAMAVDFFERSAYQDGDPLAKVLDEGGLTAAAKQVNRHKDINDAGGHENVALSFLSVMGAVDAEYAQEALRIAEILTNVMNSISFGVERLLKG